MKTFFAMFAAILCAAAVIFGFVAVGRAKDKEMEETANLILLSKKVSNSYLERTVTGKPFDGVLHDDLPVSISGLTRTIKSKKYDKERLNYDVREVAYNYRQYADFVLKIDPSQKEWLAQTNRTLDELEEAAK